MQLPSKIVLTGLDFKDKAELQRLFRTVYRKITNWDVGAFSSQWWRTFVTKQHLGLAQLNPEKCGPCSAAVTLRLGSDEYNAQLGQVLGF